MPIEIKINPIAKPRMTRSDKWKQRDCVVRYRDYKLKLLVALSKYDKTNYDTIDIEFILEEPKSWSSKKKAQMLHEHTTCRSLSTMCEHCKDQLITSQKLTSKD